MDKRFKKILLLVMIVIVIICIIIFSILFFNKKSDNTLDESHGIPDPPEVMQTEDKNTVMECKVTNEYFIVKKALTDYFLYCSNLNYKASDIDTFGHDISKEELEKSAQKEREKAQEIIFNMLDQDYINEFNIKSNGNMEKFVTSRDTRSIIKKIYKIKNDLNVNTYLVYGININEKENKTNEFQMAVSIDLLTKTFSIYPEEYFKKHNLDKLDIGDHFDEISKDKIEENKNNKFTYRTIKDNEVAMEYFNNYKYLFLYDTDGAYEILDKEYRNKRFKDIQNYKEFASKNREILKKCNATKYQANGTEGDKQFICLDNYGNYYIFNQKNISTYPLYLDTYTLETVEFLEKYNQATENKKAGMNSEKFFEAINMKDYEYIYNHLADEFKNRNFKDVNALKKYLEDNLFVFNGTEYISNEKENDVIVINVKVSDNYEKSGQKDMNIIMKIEDGTNYQMSFSIN